MFINVKVIRTIIKKNLNLRIFRGKYLVMIKGSSTDTLLPHITSFDPPFTQLFPSCLTLTVSDVGEHHNSYSNFTQSRAKVTLFHLR